MARCGLLGLAGVYPLPEEVGEALAFALLAILARLALGSVAVSCRLGTFPQRHVRLVDTLLARNGCRVGQVLRGRPARQVRSGQVRRYRRQTGGVGREGCTARHSTAQHIIAEHSTSVGASGIYKNKHQQTGTTTMTPWPSRGGQVGGQAGRQASKHKKTRDSGNESGDFMKALCQPARHARGGLKSVSVPLWYGQSSRADVQRYTTSLLTSIASAIRAIGAMAVEPASPASHRIPPMLPPCPPIADPHAHHAPIRRAHMT